MFKLILITLLSISSIYSDDLSSFANFMKFTREYKKIYSSQEEYTYRYSVFKENLKNLNSRKFDNLLNSFEEGITQFSDLTMEEFKSKFLNNITPSQTPCKTLPKFFLSKSNPTPESIDWRQLGMVSPIKNQGAAIGAWVYATMAYFESQSLMQKKPDIFNEEQVADCDPNSIGPGGFPLSAFIYLSKYGIELNYECKDHNCGYDPLKVVAKVSDVKCWENVSMDELQSQVYNIGPLTIAVDALDFQMYVSGVLACQNRSSVNHSVLLVGYTKDSWIIKNSWGKNWGERGYVRVSNQTGQNCLVGDYVISATLSFIA